MTRHHPAQQISDDVAFRITELGIDADEERRGIVRMYAIERRRLSVVVIDGPGRSQFTGSSIHPDLLIARARARGYALAQMQRLIDRHPDNPLFVATPEV